MEIFDQTTAASESQIAGKESGDEFYEDIEAPKFVDFTVADHYHPDDRYWFCLRVGCDRKHEEELNLEELNKNFVLRVMAARSPNIKIRKMLTRKQQSSTLKCPNTAPAKPSKSRISRLAVISSISRKLTDAKDKSKTKPLWKPAATPKASSKQFNSAAAKAFTTPRNRKRVSNNADKFRSVRNPKPKPSVAVPKPKVIAKALIFSSPKKKVVVGVKTSLELKTPVGKLCAAMSKLEIATAKKRALETKTPVAKQALNLDKTARKPFRGREVKSRVFDSLHSHTQKDHETKPSKSIKRKKREKDDDSSDMEIDEKSRHGSFDTSKTGEANRDEVLLETTSRTDVTIHSLPTSSEEKASGEEKVEIVSLKGIDSDDKENDLPCNAASEVDDERDEKENTSAYEDNNRDPNDNSEEKIQANHDHHLKKVNQATKKPLKKSSIAATGGGGAQEAKYWKPKPTNPKPFRLRTDERGILKEATQEKKLATQPLKEITTLVKSKSSRKNPTTPSQENDENVNIARENNETRMVKTDVDQQPRGTTVKTTRYLRTKTTVPITSDKSSERTKSPKNFMKPRGIGPSRKTVRLELIKESPKPSENGGTKAHRSAVSRATTTIPREPNFHSIHIPKSCTKKAA